MPNSIDYLPWMTCPDCGASLCDLSHPPTRCRPPVTPPEVPPPPVAPLTSGEWWQIVTLAAVLIGGVTLVLLFTKRGP